VRLTPELRAAREAIVSCTKCPRLRAYCQTIAETKRAAFRNDTYWAKPVPGFGDPQARIVLIGLAPAAHGANRTGRMFTGDGAGGSGDFLMAALHAHGLATQPCSRSADDGLRLEHAWIVATARCAPPDNKPTPIEIANCHTHLRAEVLALRRARVFVALGRIAYDAAWRLLTEMQDVPARKPAFAHGLAVPLPSGRALVASFHPSRQNTHTGRLTPAMLRDVFATATALARL
jgi:uracil-DNA glycosylase family 4